MHNLNSFLFTFIIALIILAVILQACSSGKPPQGKGEPLKHDLWDSLLKKYVDENGKVDYKGFLIDSTQLKLYLELLSTHPPAESWSRNAKLAYWINAYNAFTVKVIIDHYPVKSIKDLNPSISIPMVSTVWTWKFFEIGGVPTNLDGIEHDVLRKEFKEPRIHFAIVCASTSCPNLLNQAFTAEKMEQQLEQRARSFINDPSKNQLSPDKAELSKIFKWFKGDFTKKGSRLDFINQYAENQVREDAKVSFLEYDWSLNEQ